MHKILGLILLVITFSSSGAKITERFQWGSNTYEVISSTTTQHLFIFKNDLSPGEDILGNKVFFYAVAPGQTIVPKITSFQSINIPKEVINDIEYTSLNDSSIVEIRRKPSSTKTLFSQPQISILGYGWYRGYYVARIEIDPFLQRNDGIGLLSSLEIQIETHGANQISQTIVKSDKYFDEILRSIIINYDVAQPFKKTSFVDSTGGWFVPNAQYIKLGIPADGIYRLTYSKLKSLIPSAVNANPKNFQMFSKGKQVPIFVSGENDNVFDSTDYIEFAGLKNYTGLHRKVPTQTSEEYHDYYDRYTDTTFIWFTVGTSTGIRMQNNSVAVSTPETLYAYTAFTHIEQNLLLQFITGDVIAQQDPDWNSHDINCWQFLSGNQTQTVNFSASDIANNADSVKIYARFASWGASASANAHNISLRFNDSTIVNKLYNRYDQDLMSGSSPISKLIAGSNSIKLFSATTSSTPVNSIVTDWYEAEYPRKLKAVNDSLLFEFRSISSKSLRNISITNLSTQNILIYKLGATPVRISNVTFSGAAPFTVTFSDTVNPNDKYLVIASSKVITPLVIKTKTFVNLRSQTSQTDYIAITSYRFKNEAQQYVNYVGSLNNLSTKLVDVDDIFDEFGFGYPTSESMIRYLSFAQTWNSPIPSYLMLIGDATYDYRFTFLKPSALNFVPSYGYPVSDARLTVFSDISIYPQMYVGRLPANTSADVLQYLSTVQSYSVTPYDIFNKNYLFFSGGNPSDPAETVSFMATNDFILNTMIKPKPYAGNATHFYKTENPQSDFGPYSLETIKSTIADGAVFMSYIGHSGTQTWDNGIVDPLQLKNSRGKFSLVTDFGCSTGKFAEPNIPSFSELFVLGGTASSIAYIGNSALGFGPIASNLPKDFYSAILKDTIRAIGKAHLKGKLDYITRLGLSGTAKVALYTNTLIGDPSINLAIPKKPNLFISTNNISILPKGIADDIDSATISVVVENLGLVTNDSIIITAQHQYTSQTLISLTLKRPMPFVFDTIVFKVPTKGLNGQHQITIKVDPDNLISEINENDNIAVATFTVASTSVRILQPLSTSIYGGNTLILLNPTTPFSNSQKVSLEIDTKKDFSTPQTFLASMKKVTTEIDISSLVRNKRYYWRAKLENSSSDWATGTFYLGTVGNSATGQQDSVSFVQNNYHGVEIINGKIELQKVQVSVRAISAGTDAGRFGVVEIDGLNKIPDSFAGGHNILVLDTLTLNVWGFKNINMYDFQKEQRETTLVNFVNSIPNGFIVISVIAHDGATEFTTAGKNAYKSFGASNLISSLGFKDSYAIVGKKGAASGTAIEVLKPRATLEKAIIETSFLKKINSGYLETNTIGPVNVWSQLSIGKNEPVGSSLRTSFIGIKKSGAIDTIVNNSISPSLNLSSISAQTYPGGKMVYSFTANSSLQTPSLLSWTMNDTVLNGKNTHPAELVVSSQTVSLSKYQINEGEKIPITTSVHNVGLSSADSVSISLLTDDNGMLRQLASVVVPSIAPGDSFIFVTQYDSKGLRGNHSLLVQVDSTNRINEVYKTNNIVSIPYQVLPDTVRPQLFVFIDGNQINNGDYVRVSPDIIVRFKDNNASVLSQSDTLNFKLQLNGQPVYFSGTQAAKFIPGTTSGNAEIHWTPELKKGANDIEVFARDVSGNYSDTINLFVNVSSDEEIKDIFNIPNPFNRNTQFSFNYYGPANPDEVNIKIYTVAGRLIQDISSTGTIGFNKIPWDGRDKDGDQIGNGVYLYKVIVKQGGKQIEGLSKLVKMR